MDTPNISIVVTTWLEESKPYLNACMASIASLNYPKDKLEVILVGRPEYAPTYPHAHTVYPAKDKFGNAEGINFGVSKTNSASKYILSLNDDTVLTRNSLLHMVRAAGDGEIIINPISPCDNYINYNLQFQFNHHGQQLALKERFYRMEALKDYIPAMISADSMYPQGIIKADFLCMFASLIPRVVWEKLGPLDENFITGPDDIDYSWRAKAAGVQLAVELSCLIWHFGGPTSELTLNPEMRAHNQAYFKKKWGRLPPFTVDKEETNE